MGACYVCHLSTILICRLWITLLTLQEHFWNTLKTVQQYIAIETCREEPKWLKWEMIFPYPDGGFKTEGVVLYNYYITLSSIKLTNRLSLSYQTNSRFNCDALALKAALWAVIYSAGAACFSGLLRCSIGLYLKEKGISSLAAGSKSLAGWVVSAEARVVNSISCMFIVLALKTPQLFRLPSCAEAATGRLV